MRALFDELDSDKSGSVSVEELRVGLEVFGYKHLHHLLNDWVKEFDKNRDGQLQYKEFLSLLASTEQ